MTPAQTRLRDLRNRQSKERGRMAELAVADTLTDETRAELDGIEAGTPDLERQIRAATVAVETEESEQRAAGAAGDTPAADAENRERAELRGKVRLASYLSAAVEKRAADGAEAEYLASLEMPALGRNGGTAFPLELLAPPEQRQAHTEDRATTNVDIMTMPRTWLDRLFAETAAMRLGVNMEVGAGGLGVLPRDHGGRERGAASAVDRRGGRWRMGYQRGRVEAEAERRAAAVLHRRRGAHSGAGVGAHPRPPHGAYRGRRPGDIPRRCRRNRQRRGYHRTQLRYGHHRGGADPGGKTPLAGDRQRVHGHDRRLAREHPRPIFGSFPAWGASRLWHSTTANTNRNESVAQIMNGNGLNFMSRANITEDTTNDEIGAFIGRGRGIDGAAVAGIWDAGELIRDPYTGAAKGEVALTLCYLWDFGIPGRRISCA